MLAKSVAPPSSTSAATLVTSALRLRAVQPHDHAELSARLPALLSGDWSPKALAASQYQQRVLVKDDSPNELLGFVEYYRVLDECHLLDIAVWPEWQGKGFGLALLHALLREMQGEGCKQCLLEVRRSNAGARALYERAGFGEVGVRRNYYPPLSAEGSSEDAVLYYLALP
jgi:ribosomal-protein-alanine N-acetyltransferase